MRYVTLRGVPATSWWDTNAVDYLPRTVHEEDRKPIDTGLLDANGTKLYRVEDREPIGFIRPRG